VFYGQDKKPLMVCTHIDPHMAGHMGRCNDPCGTYS